MNVLVVGATGGSGRAAVDALLEHGHEVTAFCRSASCLDGTSDRLRIVTGDATDPAAVARAVRGQDAVVVTLGISENPVTVRLRGTARTPIDVRSRGTAEVIAAMHENGVKRLVVQTSFGVGDTAGRLPLRYRAMFRILLGPQIADTAVQDGYVHTSGLEWVIAAPVNLTDGDEPGLPHTSTAAEVAGWYVARSRVGRFLADAVSDDRYLYRTVALS